MKCLFHSYKGITCKICVTFYPSGDIQYWQCYWQDKKKSHS